MTLTFEVVTREIYAHTPSKSCFVICAKQFELRSLTKYLWTEQANSDKTDRRRNIQYTASVTDVTKHSQACSNK